MIRAILKLAAGVGGVLVSLAFFVVVLGAVTWYLTPMDPDAVRHASEFQAKMGSLVRTPEGVPPVDVPRLVPGMPEPGAVHRVDEWPADRPRNFGESPFLKVRVEAGRIPPVEQRLPANPLMMVPPHQVGPYGGTWTRFGTGPQDIGVVEARLAYDGLVRWDALGQKIIPNLAAEWWIEEGGRVYTFRLREGVKWSDGHLFSADDVLFWYAHVLRNDALTPVVSRDFKRGGEVVRVVKLSDSVVQFRFREPNGLLLQAMASGLGYEVAGYPAHYLRQFHPDFVPLEDLEARAEASGFDLWTQLFLDQCDWRNVKLPRLWPWVVVAPPPARPVVFERNPYYWKVDPEGNQLPYIDRMTFEIFDRETINFKAINGEVGMQARHLDMSNYPLFMANRKKGGYRVLHWLSGEAVDLNLTVNQNHKDPVKRRVFEDRRFRIALSLAIDREEINEVGYFGIGTPRQNAPPPFSEYYSEAYAKAYTEYDPERANRLLDEMGLDRPDGSGARLRPDGKPLEVTIEATTFASNLQLLQLVADYWTAVGVKTEVKGMARQLFEQRKVSMMHDVGVWGGADAQYPLLNPRWFFPWSSSSHQAVDYGRWFTSNGTRGQKPPPDVARCQELFRRIEETPDEDEHLRLFGEIIDLNTKYLWVIGLVGEMPAIVVVKNTFRNVPEVATSGWVYRTPGNTGIELYAIEPGAPNDKAE